MLLKPVKLLSVLIVFIFSVSGTKAQDIINLIPGETTFLGLVDLNQINTKARFADLIELPLVEKMEKELSKELFRDMVNEDSASFLDIQKYGISLKNKSYFYVKNAENVFYGALVFALDDETKFARFAETLTKTEDGKKTVVTNDYKYTNKNKLKIVWNSKSAAFYGVSISPAYKDSLQNSIREQNANIVTDSIAVEEPIEQNNIEDETGEIPPPPPPPPAYENSENEETGENEETVIDDYAVADNDSSYNYEEPYNDSYYNNYSIVTSICDSIESDWSAKNIGILLQDKGANSVAGNKEFMEYVKNNPDAACMFDYGQFMNMYMSSIMGMSSYGLTNNIPVEYMKSFYKGLNMFGKLELNQDDVQLKLDMKHSDKINEIYKEIKKTNISKNFLKYLNNDLMGYYALGIDIEGMAKGFNNTIKNVSKYGQIAGSAIDVIDIFIDEQSIYKIFTGDMVVAVNGVKPVESIHTSYNYDENFNMTEVQDTTMQMQPEILFMLGIGNVSDVNKILKLLINFNILKQEGSLYTLSIKNTNLPVYLKIQDDILFMSNNKACVEQPQVYDKNKQLSKEHTKMFRNNSYIAYANTSKIAQYFAQHGSSEDEKVLIDAAALFKSVKMLGQSKNGHSTASCVLELSKTSDNSIVDILKFMNTLYIAKGKKL